ncbi:DUF3570 domain-containing protein [Dyadobacter psychrotolerans]|uniref:DUF3570 domain-containing protein n=1 Tax=Dyadobacter psychrotolerans TaxID=2541721 RepID=A0A4R5DSD1_9BACT|nr:DUF3570 domain-containing protein [Dyadobacter psychrotolerans]TDE15254.1 DUF3570 domain-containing protein [Dyadobacter psychrotolerans]
MKKITLTVAALLGLFGSLTAQVQDSVSTAYKAKKLKIEEVNFVSAYYSQNGDNSAITGGIGTEKLFDIANSLEIKLVKTDRLNRVHSISADLNIDYYSSASQDNIDPLTISSASRTDIHLYPTISWNMKDDRNHTSRGAMLSYSTEYDYKSYGFNLNFSKSSKDNNREITFKAGTYRDTYTAILPSELRPNGYSSGAEGDKANLYHKPRNTYNGSVSLSQIVNKRLQVLFIVEPTYQEGLLSTPFHRTYFTDGSERVEKLPGSRFKIPIGLRCSYFLGDKLIIRTFYRFYADNWGMKAHTFSLETPVKITPFVSLSPFYRFSTQSAIRYFAPYMQHDPSSKYYSSDYDLSSFQSHFAGSGIRFAPPGGIAGIRHFASLEIRYGHFYRNAGAGMQSNIITLAAKFK